MNFAYITASFPFGPGETFLIPEIAAFSQAINDSMLVVPLHPRGERRGDWGPVQPNVHVLEEKLFSFPILLDACKMVCRSPLRTFAALRHIFRLPIRHAIKNFAVFPKAIWLARQIERNGIEHVHAHWAGTTSTLAMLAADIANIGWSFTCHRWDIYENNLLSLKSHSARFIRFISERGMRDAFKLGVPPAKSLISHMGVDQVYAKGPRNLVKRAPVIMCAANLLEVKGHAYLLHAIALMTAAGTPVFLKLAGIGPLRDDLEMLVRSFNLEMYVEFLGHLEQKSLLALYAEDAIDLFVLASVDLGNGHHEGVPVCLMEAMSFGIPVVSTKTGSIEELLDPSLEITVPDKDPVALAKAITDLISQPRRYQEISERVIKIVRDGWLIEVSAREILNKIQNSRPLDKQQRTRPETMSQTSKP